MKTLVFHIYTTEGDFPSYGISLSYEVLDSRHLQCCILKKLPPLYLSPKAKKKQVQNEF